VIEQGHRPLSVCLLAGGSSPRTERRPPRTSRPAQVEIRSRSRGRAVPLRYAEPRL
jgi:hypothetical protein